MTKSQLFERMKADILVGTYRPGEWLRLADMETHYGANRFEMRSALTALHAIKLLEHEQNRGYRIASVTAESWTQVIEVRLLLEIPAAAQVIRNATDADIANLEALAESFAQAVAHAGIDEIDRINHLFHRAFFASCANRRLTDLIHNQRETLSPSGWRRWWSPAGAQRSAAEHFEMIAALKSRDLPRLEATIRKHTGRQGADAVGADAAPRARPHVGGLG
uniref:GntR family transcriptional regulator n=1 Tax=Bosea sp. NBC_00436 TaxID=2969620 RepID=A0A9E8CU84_9HYPH